MLATVGLIVFAVWTASQSTPLASAAAVQSNLVDRIPLALLPRDAGAGAGKDDSLSHTGTTSPMSVHLGLKHSPRGLPPGHPARRDLQRRCRARPQAWIQMKVALPS